MKEIYFAGGCFWGTEHFFKQIDRQTSRRLLPSASVAFRMGKKSEQDES